MNASHANAIALSQILHMLGFHPVSQKGNDCWYLSPLRKEKTPSFHVNDKKNIWYDFGGEKGGTVIDFVQAYLQSQGEDHTVRDALRWLENMILLPEVYSAVPEPEFTETDACLTLKARTDLKSACLIRYLEERGISQAVATKYIKELHIHNSHTGNDFFCLGFKNEDDGYELRNPMFKGCLAPKTLSFIRGSKVLPKEIHVFEGFMDFLTVLELEHKQKLQGDAIVLNSVSCLSQALPYIRNYGYETLYSWLDNDHAGKQALSVLDSFIGEQKGLTHKPMNQIFEQHKDVNAWRVASLKLDKKP